MFYVGADVSKGRWLTVRLSENHGWEVGLVETVREIWDDYYAAALILIDIPIGLREHGRERLCDVEARRHLGPRGSSVFRVPCRAALSADNYIDANRINRDRTDKGVSKQSWAIVPKIREVGEFLNCNIAARRKIREIHPEVCFWALNGGRPMMFNKKTNEGVKERVKVLHQVCNQTCAILEFAGNEFQGKVPDDDIIDGLVAAVTAFLGKKGLLTIPRKPETDAMGLRMEMVYYFVA